MLIHADRSALLVIDMQQKVVPAVLDSEGLIARIVWLVRAAQKIGIPVAATEHVTKDLGHTVPAVRSLLPDGAVAEKSFFSGVAAQCLAGLPGADRAQVVIAGVESHVCVLQTALDLVQEGREVFVVADAVSSRRDIDRDLALQRMRQEGVRLVSREMAVFEWLARGATPLYKEVNREFLR